jgi:hypothetical protein
MTTTQHRRPSSEPKVEAFKAFACFACGDTGIIGNADGLLSQLVDDYDRLPDGRTMAGSDVAVICRCHASYPQQNHDGRTARGGFREGDGTIRRVMTELGPRALGVEIRIETARQIEQARRRAWKATADSTAVAASIAELAQ